MRIAYDHQIFAAQRYGGISRYLCALASNVSRTPGVSVRVIAPVYVADHLRQVDPRLVTGRHVPQLPKTGRIIRGLNAALFPPLVRSFDPDIVHETYYAAAPTARTRARTVVTVYDMIHELFPASFGAHDPVPAAKAGAVRRADHVICISENTRRDLLHVHALPPERVSVVPLGFDRLDPGGLTAAALVGPRPYLLHVGLRGGYKNFMALAEAVASSPALRAQYRLVCFGGGGFREHERTAFARLGFRDGEVMQLAGGDEMLAALYLGAAALVYPSLYEGFGIPPLEAMALGCPVVSSESSSLPEVCGDAAEYFDPRDAHALVGALERVLGDESRKQQLVSLGHARSAAFSWSRCATMTYDVYARVLADSPDRIRAA